MFDVNCVVKDSLIQGAGKGLFAGQKISKAKVIVYPNQEHMVLSKDRLFSLSPDSIEFNSSIRWFEDRYTIDPTWSNECYFNHSFSPNCLWHLGFVFALRDISEGEELTIDYSNLLDDSIKLDYLDSITQKEIKGLSYQEKMRKSAESLVKLFS